MATTTTSNGSATTTSSASTNSSSSSSLTSSTMIINGVTVPVEYPQNSQKQTIEFILAAPKVADYFAKINPEHIVVSKVIIFHHFMFGPHVGFVFMNLICTDKATGKPLPGVVFLRGDAVACLTLVQNIETGELSMVLLEQSRVPAGCKIFEINAGMVDDKLGQERLVMTKEAQEETGIVIESTGVKTDDPRNQFKFLEKLGKAGMSKGGCDESITFFWYMVQMTSEEIRKMNGKHIVNEEEGETAEIIKLVMKKFTLENVLNSGDAKAICAVGFLMGKYPGFVPLN